VPPHDRAEVKVADRAAGEAAELQVDQQLGVAGTVAIAGLSPASFPNMRDTAREARQVGPDEEFHGGLALLLKGIGG